MPDPTDTPIRLLIGLGNPGRQYAETRHNVGWMIVDRLAAAAGSRFSLEKKWRAELARVGELWIVKPQTYMNLSGEAAAAVAAFYRIPPAACVAVYDDKDLPFGVLRLRAGGSAGGHNGVKSLIAHLGTQEFPRLRFGIGASGPHLPEAIGHVLSPFSDVERRLLEKRLDRAVEALNYAARFGFSKAMNQFNRPEPGFPPPTAPVPPNPIDPSPTPAPPATP
ncbi:MAG: aminoacyl-tRNA hydrolase [Verrucomicrobiales bacterium]